MKFQYFIILFFIASITFWGLSISRQELPILNKFIITIILSFISTITFGGIIGMSSNWNTK
jgi:hypothetical protein